MLTKSVVPRLERAVLVRANRGKAQTKRRQQFGQCIMTTSTMGVRGASLESASRGVWIEDRNIIHPSVNAVQPAAV